MAERSKKSICVIDVCTCRQELQLIGQPCGKLDKPSTLSCTVTGLAAEGAIKYGYGRRISRDEFLDHIKLGEELGLISMLDGVKDPIMVCTCCDCCCSIMRVLNDFSNPNALLKSHFEVVIDIEKCNGCKTCEKSCQVNVITVGKYKKARVDSMRCIGCVEYA